MNNTNTDFVYANYGSMIKESIIVRAQQDSYVYDFLLSTDLDAQLDEATSNIVFTDTDGNIIYLIPAPYMSDDAGEISLAVNYSLRRVAEGYVLTVTADSTWINDDARQFPVTIDPSITTTANLPTTGLTMSYVAEGSPSRVFGNVQTLYSGYSRDNTIQEAQIYMGLIALPKIPQNAVVINADLRLYQSSWSQTSCPSADMGIYELDQAPSNPDYFTWINGLSWNTKPQTLPDAVDYVSCTAYTKTTYLIWNITRPVKEWYADPSTTRALALKLIDRENYSSEHAATATFIGYHTSACPYYTVWYKYAVGLESYYSGQTQSIGRAGTGFVGDYSGKLTLSVDDISSYAPSMPINISHIYNSAYSGGQIAEDTPGGDVYASMSVGNGWKLNIQQSVKTDGNYLRYLDGDGSVHYFTKVNSYTYMDEDGLNLTLLKGGSNYTLRDRYDNKSYFHSEMLSSVLDANGNTASYDYNAAAKQIVAKRKLDGKPEETVATLQFDDAGFLTSITDTMGVTSYSYDAAGNLTGIAHPDGTSVTYDYDENSMLTSATDNESGYTMHYSYGAGGTVTGYSESVGNQTGASVEVSGVVGTKTFRCSGNDGVLNTADDIITSDVLDWYGRTISSGSFSSDYSDIYGASAAQFSANSGYAGTNNRMLASSSSGVQSDNCVINGGAENGDSGWTISGASLTQYVAEETAEEKYQRTGTKSFKIYNDGSNYTATLQQNISGLIPNAWYVVSAYVKTSYSAGTGSIHVDNSSNGVSWNTTGISDGWERIYGMAQADEYGNVQAKIILDNLSDAVYIDDVQVEKSISGENCAPGGLNLLENSTFNSPQGWTANGTGIQFAQTDEILGCCAQITGTQSESKSIAQTVQLNMPSAQTYMCTAWIKAHSLPQKASRTFGLRVTLTYSDNTSEVMNLLGCSDSTAWQYLVLPIVPQKANATVANATLEFIYDNNFNNAYVTHVCLKREEAQSYKYNSFGDVISVSSPSSNTQTFGYSGANLIGQVTPGSGSYAYEYDSHHNNTKVTNDSVSMASTYDEIGNTTSTLLTAQGSALKMKTSATYDNSGKFVASSTDATGGTTTYAYDSDVSKAIGSPTSVTAPNTATTTTSYDSNNGRTTSTGIAGTASLDYSYSSGRLSTITRTDSAQDTQTYNINYDNFGN